MSILEDRVAIVTGAAQGIGRSVALALAHEGASVVANDVSEQVNQTVDTILSAGGKAVGSVAAVGSAETSDYLVTTAKNNFGKIDILVNVAGILRDRMSWNMTDREWDEVITVHLRGSFENIRAVLPLMRGQQYGRIINFSSRSGILGNTGQVNYASAKAGILGMTRTLAKELSRFGITVNAIAPSALTGMTQSVPDATRELRQAQGIANPNYGLGSPDDVAPLIAYLASEEAGDLTGLTIGINGERLTLWSNPQPLRVAFQNGGWTVEALGQKMRTVLEL